MSLLMDALKQAEHAKRGTKQDPQPPSTPTAVEPAPAVEKPATEQPAMAPVATPKTLDAELSLAPAETTTVEVEDAAERFDAVSEPLTADAAQATPHAAKPTAEAAPETKITAPAHAEKPPPEAAPTAPQSGLSLADKGSKNSAQVAARVLAASEARMQMQRKQKLYGLVGLGVLMSLAMVGYYYYATRSYSPSYMQIPDLPERSTTALAPVLAEATAPPEQTPWRPGAAPQETATDWQGAPVDARVLRGEQPAPEAELAAEPESTAPRATIRISRSTRSDRVSDALQTAYLDYQAGRYAQANAGYRTVIAAEPANRDAKLGLAALALQRGETETARSLYQELLRLDPKDSAAQAALASLQTEPSAATESELKLLLAEQPNAAQLHFALANLYAAQARWPLAQQAYFDAQRLAPTHPDYAFNLAISLEHLSQPQAALDYYRRALTLAARQPANFSIATAEQRVRALQGQPRP